MMEGVGAIKAHRERRITLPTSTHPPPRRKCKSHALQGVKRKTGVALARLPCCPAWAVWHTEGDEKGVVPG
jgi:hypothetical protein